MTDCWIQKHDYDSMELDYKTAAECVSAFTEFDWLAELANHESTNDLKNCPPGFGLNIDGEILHICPKNSESVFFNFHHESKTKILGLFPHTTQQIHYVAHYSFGDVQSLIHHFVSGNRYEILSIK